MSFKVYMNNVPKVGDDGKPVPIVPPRSQEFSELEEAQAFAAQHKDEFERVTIMREIEDKYRMIERYMDAEHIVNDKEEAPEPEVVPPTEEPAAAAAEADG